MTVWWTADLHLNHRKISTYAKRPFSSIEEMNEVLINNWNNLVKPNDLVYCLGDIGFYKKFTIQEVKNQLNQLNGEIILIQGNHDCDKVINSGRFKEVHKLLTIFVHDEDVLSSMTRKVILCHYPLRSWESSHRGSFSFHGHSHGSLLPLGNSIDVGIDCFNYFPISYEQIKQRMKDNQGVVNVSK